MPRTRRHRRTFNTPGHAHALTVSCYRGYRFLEAERTCAWLAEAIEAARKELQFMLWAYVFMPNHAHLLILPRHNPYDISAIRKRIKAPVASRAIAFLEQRAPEWIPRITRRRGAKVERLFWQSGGGYDRNLIEPSTLMATLDYIHMNPVRWALAERAADWKWSSASWYAGSSDCPLRPDAIPADWLD
jgi:putative transposase